MSPRFLIAATSSALGGFKPNGRPDAPRHGRRLAKIAESASSRVPNQPAEPDGLLPALLSWVLPSAHYEFDSRPLPADYGSAAPLQAVSSLAPVKGRRHAPVYDAGSRRSA
jgi:hypothetical protein